MLPVSMLAISTASMSTYTTSPDGESLASWAATINFELLHNPRV